MHVQNIINTTIIDIGTTFIKAGYASSTLPSIYASSSSSVNDFTSPLKHSRIQSMDNYLSLMENTFKFVPSKDLIIVLNNESRICKERIIEHLYETKTIENVLLHESTLLSVFAYGKTMGLSIEFSDSISVVAIVGGLILARADLAYGGEELTKLFTRPEITKFIDNSIVRLAEEKSRHFTDNHRKYLISNEEMEIKEHILSLDRDEEKIIEFAGQTLKFDAEYLNAMDFLMNELKETVKTVIDSCPEEHKYPLLSNIILSGGCASINGIAERVNSEICKIFPQPKVKVTYEKNFHGYLGASILGSLGSIKAFFIGEKDYEEFGSNILEHKNMSWWVS